jgi:hypothetical protein
VAVVAEVVGDLAFQRGLDHTLGELGEQPRTDTAREPGDQLLIDRVQIILIRSLVADELVQVHGLLGHRVSHQVLLS